MKKEEQITYYIKKAFSPNSTGWERYKACTWLVEHVDKKELGKLINKYFLLGGDD